MEVIENFYKFQLIIKKREKFIINRKLVATIPWDSVLKWKDRTELPKHNSSK